MNIIYVTSFNEEIYKMSGYKLINSFIKNNKFNEKLIVCYENFNFKNNDPNIIGYDLNNYLYFKKWLLENKKNIPEKYDGTANKINNKKVFNKWNIRFSKWYRKVVSLKYVKENFESNIIVWLDADCILTSNIRNIINKEIENNHLVYFLGARRKKLNCGIESGLLIFNKINESFFYLDKLIKKYENYEYEKFDRWDDGYILKIIVFKYKDLYKVKDIAKNTEVNVMNFSNPFHKKLIHKKGVHNKIFKNVGKK